MRRHLTLRSERLTELADGELSSVRGASHVYLHCLLTLVPLLCDNTSLPATAERPPAAR